MWSAIALLSFFKKPFSTKCFSIIMSYRGLGKDCRDIFGILLYFIKRSKRFKLIKIGFSELNLT